MNGAVTNLGTLQAVGGTLNINGIFVNENLIKASGGSVSITGSSFQNDGTIQTASTSTITINTLNNYNSATKTLTDSQYYSSGLIRMPSGADIQTNAADIVLNGSGLIYAGSTGTVNALVNFNNNSAAGSFTVTNGKSFNTSGNFSNAGTINIDQTASFKVGANGTSNYVQASGVTTVNGNLQANVMDIDGGVLKGTGTINGDVTVDGGILHPGNSPGILTINGDYTNSGILDIQVLNLDDGPGIGYNQLFVTGVATLGGILQINFSPETEFYTGDVFDIIHVANGYTGQFESITGLPSYFDIQYGLSSGGTDIYLVALRDFSGNLVPIPSSLWLFAAGLLGLWGIRRRTMN